MPIEYTVLGDGHLIHAIARAPVTIDEFLEYEVAHATDERIHSPVSELLEIQPGALSQITEEEISKILKRRKAIGRGPTTHRCGIVVSYGDNHGWDIVKFYESMVILHSSEIVIVFGDVLNARRWLGFEQHQPNKSTEGDVQ